jgi:hypothetical protein
LDMDSIFINCTPAAIAAMTARTAMAASTPYAGLDRVVLKCALNNLKRPIADKDSCALRRPPPAAVPTIAAITAVAAMAAIRGIGEAVISAAQGPKGIPPTAAVAAIPAMTPGTRQDGVILKRALLDLNPSTTAVDSPTLHIASAATSTPRSSRSTKATVATITKPASSAAIAAIAAAPAVPAVPASARQSLITLECAQADFNRSTVIVDGSALGIAAITAMTTWFATSAFTAVPRADESCVPPTPAIAAVAAITTASAKGPHSPVVLKRAVL